ncbi:MAG TPA: hypothetical protein VN695_14720, partial [Streptosporangiaceae bacterium]|nr:hypothetical protein [Streptosporangiaceae bacterium]
MVVVTALAVVLTALAGASTSPVVHGISVTHPSATITRIADVAGQACQRKVTVTADIPKGDSLAIYVAIAGTTGADFQS